MPRSRKRKRNRLPTPSARLALVKHLRVAKPYYAVSALKLGKRLWLDRDGKLTVRSIAARRFASLGDATRAAKHLLSQHPHLRSYRFAVHKGY